MFGEFIHYYNYTADEALNEYAKRFFGLVNSMYRLVARDKLTQLIINNNATIGGKEAEKLADELKKQSKGNQGVLEEVRNIKGLQNNG